MHYKEFSKILHGPNILIRLELIRLSNHVVSADGRLYVFVSDKYGEFCHEIRYGTSPGDEYKPLELHPFPEKRSQWEAYFHSAVLPTWKSGWSPTREAVCTFRPSERDEAQQIKPSHPLALSHLSRIHGMLLEAQLEGQVQEDIVFVAKVRLDGLIRSLTTKWLEVA